MMTASVMVALAMLASGVVAEPSVATSDDLTYIQVQCFDKKCSQDCDGGPIPSNTCIPSTGGGAAMLQCFPTYLQQKLWTNGDCSGTPANTTHVKLDVCTKSSVGEYYENLCCKKNDSRQICTGPSTNEGHNNSVPEQQFGNATWAKRWIH